MIVRATLTRRLTLTHSLRHRRFGHHRLARLRCAPHRTDPVRVAKWGPLQVPLHHWQAGQLRKAKVAVNSLLFLSQVLRLALEAMAKVGPVVLAPSVAAVSAEMLAAAQAARMAHSRLVREVAGMHLGAFLVVLAAV